MKVFITILFAIIFSYNLFCQNDEWTVYTTSNSGIPFNKINSMAIDKNNNIWCGYDNSGNVPHLTCFDGNAFTNYFNSGWVNDITVDQYNIVYVITSGAVIKIWDGSSWLTEKTDYLDYPWSFPIYADLHDNIWLFSDESLLKFTGTKWIKYDSTNSPFNKCYIESIADAFGSVWFATNSCGLFKYDGSNWEVFTQENSPLPNNNIFGLCTDKDGKLWITTKDKYLISYDGTNWDSKQVNTDATSIRISTIDSKGNLWLKSEKGVIKLDLLGNITNYNEDNSPLKTNSIFALDDDNNGNIWIGTWGEGLYKLKEASSSVNNSDDILNYSSLEPNVISEYSVLKYGLNKPAYVKLSIYNELGILVQCLEFGLQEKGNYFNQIDFSEFNNGYYFYILEADRIRENGKFVVIK